MEIKWNPKVNWNNREKIGKEEETKNKWQRENIKIIDLNPTIKIITLSVNH